MIYRMNILFHHGDVKKFYKTISSDDIAAFESGIVHDVYATFALARDAEWSGRLFVLEMKEADEEGIGTQLQVTHVSPAFVGDEVVFESTFVAINEKNEIMTSFKVFCKNRLIAEGIQGQKILKKEKIDRIFQTLKNPTL